MSIHRVIEAAKLLVTDSPEKPEKLCFNLSYLQTCLETLESSAYKDEIQELVEQAWLRRAKAQYYGKPSSVKYKNAEIEFFCGAMSAMHALFPDNGEDRLSSLVPTAWVFNPMIGSNVVEVA